MACTRLCPVGALRGGGAGAELFFQESACVQCGVCQAGCPEQAVRLVPSFEPDAVARSRPDMVARSDLACCVQCGTPFMPRALLESSLNRIGDPAGEQDAAKRVLYTCPRCRAAAVLSSPFIDGRGGSS
jgi:ferredoxin